ncbi:MAG: sodium-translocating pyrophosphatase [Clostridiaceae bacterium]|jgi:K(+)-stimulated pyrophosphate-energized sodium pump|nr:sodium-translocating pyrophosphatase [Clostridiaceae bacterium]
MNWPVVAILVSILAFGVAAWLYTWVKSQPSSNPEVARIGLLIKKGANTFLGREYKILAIFVAIVSVLIVLFLPQPIWKGSASANIMMAISYIVGSALSALAGKIGIAVATIANVKSAEAATNSMNKSFMSGFRGGSVMGMAVVGSSLIGVTAVLMLTGDATSVLGFSFGASSLALFAKAGGGVFTKTADISADLVGKVELGIPEDDPRNPAVIADNVGDNVGDVAGMGADLFDSNVAAMSAALVLAVALDGGTGINTNMILCYTSLGLLSSIIGVLSGRIGKSGNPSSALNKCTYITTILFAILTAIATPVFGFNWRYWGATIVGLFVGTVIGLTSDYFTNDAKKPVQHVASASKSGPAFTILSGFSYGLYSVLPALLGIGISAMASFYICDGIDPASKTDALFGIAMSAIGMLSIVGMIISNDAYGPIVDNARGLVEMGNLGDEALRITDELDSAGNTVKAITKGFAVSAAGLTVIALLGAFMTEANAALVDLGKQIIEGFDVMNPLVFFGMIVGVAIPAIFSAMLIMGVDRNAQRMVKEIHRQFDEIPGLKEGKEGVVPEYDRCIDIATTGALKELLAAGIVIILSTLAVGFIGGVRAIGGFITGNIMSGLLLALLMGNAGGTWDNAKKYVEAGNEGGKGSVAHRAAVVGDTVGDPFKDTAGPSINTQITVVTLVASLASGLFASFSILG